MTLIDTPQPVFRVFRLDLPLDAETFDGLLAQEPTVALTVCPHLGDDALAWKSLAQAHVYHVSSAKDDLPAPWFVGPALLQRCPNLLAVSAYGAGFDTVDADACTRAGVAVMNQAGSNASAVAEHALGLMLGLSKRIAESDRRLRRGERFTRAEAKGFDLRGRKLGLVGIGHAGGHTARLAAAFGMNIIAHDPFVDPAEIKRRGAEPVLLDELLQRADVVSLHCPLDATTKGMFGAAAFARMKAGALFISTARGGIHDEAALFDALKSGHLAGAGLDVWQVEPPPADHPLLGLDTVLATHHTAGVTVESRKQMATMAASQIIGLGRGVRPPRLVNPEVWPVLLERMKRAEIRA